jgi:hypothetical protein
MVVRMRLACAMTAAALLVSGCAAPDRPSPDIASIAPANDRFSERPAVFADDAVAQPDREQLEQLLLASSAILMSDALQSNAGAIQSTYPEIFLNGTLGYKRPADVVSLLQMPRSGMRYRRTPVVFGSGAITGFDGQRWRMAIKQSTLDQWLSDDPVMRSCAVNTVAHEITHTFVSESSGSMSFIDGGLEGFRSRRNGTTGSYVIGQLAQCTWLAEQGRIAKSEVAACVPVFYSKPGWLPWSRGKLAVGRCNDFADGRRVSLQ